MNNALRSELLAQTKKAQQLGFKGSIMDVLSNPMVLQEFTQQQNRSRVEVASTPQQQQQGLSGVPANQMPEAMVFPNVKPNTSFNTKDMLASINIQKYDEQGHLVKSYENVPPGITNLPMGPQGGTVIETPANVAQSGGRKKYQSGARGESMDYIEPKTVFRINTDRQGNITNTENQPASKTTALDPKRFFSIWNNSPMYRQMMQGKEQDLNVNTPDSSWNTYMTAAESENRLNAVLSPDPYNYTEYTKNNPLPNLRPNFEGLVEAAKERGAAGENITDFRNYNLQNLSFKSLPDYASGSTMAAMSPGKGDIMVKSSLSENLVGPAIVHELSHMQDMHIRDLNNPKNSIISIGPRYGDHFRRLYRSEDSPMILDSTISESGVPLMPRQDYKKIRDYSRANERVLPESYGVSLPSTSSEEFTTQKEKNKIDFAQYVTHPSETRARLNATRYEANKVVPNLWNPFYQSMTPEILNELKLLIPDNEENLEFLNLRQLLNFYTDEQIIDMFNSISMHEDASSSEDIPKTQSGGIRKYQSSSPTEYFEQKPLTSSDFDYTTDRSRGNARFFSDPITGEPFPLVNLPAAEVVAQRTPYNQLSNQSLLAGVTQAKPWFEAGNYKMGYKVLKEREEDLQRANIINEFTGIPALGRTADRVQNDPADLFTFEGGLDALSFIPSGILASRGTKALAQQASPLAKNAGKFLTRQTPKQLPGSSNVDEVSKLNFSNKLSSAKNQLSKAVKGTSSVLDELKGELLQGKINRESIKKGNEWLENWIKNPATKEKIDTSIDDKIDFVAKFYNAGSVFDEVDLLNLIRTQSRDFKPSSKEYSLLKQLDKNLQQYMSKNSEKSIHQGNWGVSYKHGVLPEYRMGVEQGKFKPFDRYGSWISRTVKLPQDKRISTTIHEGTHDWISAEAFKKSGMRNTALQHMDPKIKKDFLEWEFYRELGIDPVEKMGKERAYQAYLANPTEQHARIMELRYDLGIPPEYKMDLEDAEKVLKWIDKGGSKIDSKFLNVVGKDPKKLAELFNKFWMAPAAIGAGAAAVAGSEPKQIIPPDFKYGGPVKYQNGGPTNPPYTAQRSSTAVKEPVIQGQRPYETLANPSLIGIMPKDQGEIKQSSPGALSGGPSLSEIVTYGPGQRPGYMQSRNLPENYYEPLGENVAEFFDPTGVLSHDDAGASFDSWKKSGRPTPTFEESLNMASALPAIGKFKILGRMAYQPKLFDFLQGSWNNFITTAGAAKKLDNVTDVGETMQQFLEYVDKKNLVQKAYGGPISYQNGGLPGEPIYKSQSAAAPLAYNSPTANGYLLPDPNRPELMNTGATEYKMGVDDVTIPTVVNGQYFSPETAYQRYKLTGEKFKPTADPSAYSKFYDEINRLGIMKNQGGGPTNPPKEQSYLSDLYNTGKKYLNPFVSEISEQAQAFIADKWPSIKNFGIESAKDLTGAAFDTIVSPPKVDEETGKKAKPSFYDNWVYAPIRNMSTSVLPSNIVALKQSMEGIETPLENSFFPSSELQDIYSLVKRAKADGRDYVTYTDYNPVGNVMEQKSVSGYLGNQEKVRTTLGQFTFEEDPETGVITIKDTYDFNPSTLDAHNVSKFTKEELSKKKPSELLDLGYNYYINQGKNEATAMYLATRYWVAPYHAKGNPPVNLTLNPEDYKDVEADRPNQTTTPNVGTNEFRSGGKKAKYKPPKMY